jgi:hypothetical protein
MTLEKSINLINDIYWVQVGLPPVSAYPAPFTPQEKNRLAQYGEPVVACGGTFVAVISPEETFTLPANDLVFPSQFPVKQQFAIADYEDATQALLYATAFRNTIVTRITTAVTNLVDNVPGAIGSEISVINTGGN